MLKFICYAAKSGNAVVKSFKSIICFKGFPGFGILNKNITNVIIFNIYAINFLHIFNGAVRIVSAVHIIGLIDYHAPFCKGKGLKPKSVVLKRCARSFVVADIEFIKKRLFINAAPSVHNKANCLRSLAWVKHFVVILIFSV